MLRVEAASDLRSAKVVVSIMGDDQTRSLSLHGLNSSRGFLQKRVADRLQTRYTPLLSFELDSAATTNVAETNRILAELEAERAATAKQDSESLPQNPEDSLSYGEPGVSEAEESES